MTLYAADEPTEALPRLAPQRAVPSTVRVLGRVVDWLGVSVMALLVCTFICQQGFGAIRMVETAAEFPLAIATATFSSATQGPAQEYIEHTEWARVGDLRSLRVYPTAAGRQPAVGVVNPDAAWAQVVAMSPDADTPGMREQFVCHLRFAEFAEPGKVSWNLEPWRPIVDGASMIQSRCNPGGAEERL
jgi:Protein of unknown function (DUF2599)